VGDGAGIITRFGKTKVKGSTGEAPAVSMGGGVPWPAIASASPMARKSRRVASRKRAGRRQALHWEWVSVWALVTETLLLASWIARLCFCQSPE